jgi:hypothetical protein
MEIKLTKSKLNTTVTIYDFGALLRSMNRRNADDFHIKKQVKSFSCTEFYFVRQ